MAGHRLGALEWGEGGLTPFQRIPASVPEAMAHLLSVRGARLWQCVCSSMLSSPAAGKAHAVLTRLRMGQGFFRIIKNQGAGDPSPKTPSPPPQTKVTIVGKNEIYNRENLAKMITYPM